MTDESLTNSNSKTLAQDQEFTSATEMERQFPHPILVWYKGGSPCKRFELHQDVTVIGRQQDVADIWINEPSVSRQHCRLEQQESGFVVTDLGSSNHTYVNTLRIRVPHLLRHGDTLRLGLVRLRYYERGTSDQLLFEVVYSMAVQDPQLGVFRKEYLLEKLADEVAIAHENQVPLTVLLLDIDTFKSFNDTYGHEAGDHVLQELCQLIMPLLRPTDTFARYGGEEFCILLEGMSQVQAIQLAEQIRKKVASSPILWGDQQLSVTLSLGVSVLTSAIATPEKLLAEADEMLYCSKHAGRNQVSALGYGAAASSGTEAHC
jgi:diguanylate cyclase (GGDEF)-like protein